MAGYRKASLSLGEGAENVMVTVRVAPGRSIQVEPPITGKSIGRVVGPGDEIAVSQAEADRLIASGFAVDPDTPAVAVLASTVTTTSESGPRVAAN